VLKLKHLINLFILFLLMVSFNSVGLPQCSAVFPGGVANYNDGYTTLRKKVKIHDSNNGSIITKNLYISAGNGNGNKPKCDGKNCVKSNTNAITSSESALIPDIVNDGSTTNLPTTLNGDYFIKLQQVYMLNDYTVTGPTRIFIESGFANLSSNLTISGKINNGGVPENLIIYVKGNLTASSGTKLSSYIYLTGYANIGSQTQITGALTSGWGVDLGDQSQIHYQLPPSELKGVCGQPQSPANLISEYRFDATSWVNGTANQVVDSVSGFNGTAYGTQPIDGKLCNAVDLSASGVSDYIDLSTQAIDGKSDFSISFWLNSNNSSGQSIFSGANSSSYYELVMWFNSPTDFQPYIKNNPNGTISTSSVADNTWHHIVWTRSGTQNCLYRDKALQGCVSHSSASLDINKFILGQEQFSGGHDSRYDFEGLIDEMLIFDGTLTSAEITTIYDNQNLGLGYDGSARTCSIVPPVLDMRFDEESYSGTNSVLDNSENNFHGTGVNVLPVDGLLCKAADLSSDSVNDYITMNASAMNGLNDFTVVVWGKSSSSQDSTILSGARDTSTQGINESVFFFKNNNEFWPSITASPFDDNTQLGTSVSMNDNNWHQLVWTRKATAAQSCFYFDGVSQGCITHPDNDDTAALQIASLILGQEQDSFQGGFDSAQDWEGLLDELTIFDSVLNSNQINSIKTNIESSKNWDGSTRSCGLIPVAEYHFDETSWDGSAGDVKDTSNNNLHLTSYNAITNNSSPVISGTPGFCRYGEFNGSNSYVQLDSDNSLISLASELSITAWINPDVLPTGSNLKAIVSKDENYEFHLNSSGEIFWWWGGGTKELTTSGANITPSTWYHLAITYKDGQQKIYIDGVEKATSSRTGNLTLNNDSFQVGQDQGFSGRYFDGSIDEVRIFDRYLTQADVNTIKNDTRTCLASVDHYRLELIDNTGLTCEAETMTLKACENASCSSVYSGNSTVDLSPNTGWLDNNDSPVTDGIFNLTSGSADIKFSQTIPATISYVLQTATPTADLKCYTASSEVNCETVFSDTGFIFTDNTGSELIKSYATAESDHTDIYLKAVTTNDNTGACTTAFEGVKSVDFQANCSNPSSCNDGGVFKVNGTTIAKDSNSTAINLDFDSGNNYLATISAINYNDAGLVELNVSAVAATGKVLSSSTPIVFAPAELVITLEDAHVAGIDDSYADNIAHSKFKLAGEIFEIKVHGIGALGGLTPNFDFNSITNNDFDVTHNLQLPNSGIFDVGIFDKGNSVSTLNNIQFSNATWSEVGIIELTAKVNGAQSGVGGYLTHPNNISGNLQNIGRFVPAQFTVEGFSVNSACPTGDFTYFSEPFTTSYTVKARNADVNVDGVGKITTNYQNYFVKETIKYWLENEDSSNYQSGSSLAGRLTATSPATSLWNKGELAVISAQITFNRSIIEAPYENTGLLITIENSEGGVLLGNQDHQQLVVGAKPAFQLNPGDLKFRYGRLSLHDSYGSDYDTMQVPMRVEYFDGSDFVLNIADSCTSYNQNLTQVAPSSPDLSFILKGSSNTFSSGIYNGAEGLYVEPLTPAHQGNFNIEYSATPTWFQFDWQGDGSQLNPRSNIQFGRFRSNDRIIYWREQ